MTKAVVFLLATLTALPVQTQACALIEAHGSSVTIQGGSVICMSPRGVMDTNYLSANEEQLKSVGCFTSKNGAPGSASDALDDSASGPVRVRVTTPKEILSVWVRCDALQSR